MSGQDGEVLFDNTWVAFAGHDGRDHVTVRDLNLHISGGEFVCIIGPSGCGKSTLLNLAAGTLKPKLGKVYYDGREVTGINTKVGYMTQDDNLLPWRTLEENVGIALEVQGVPAEERRQRVGAMLDTVGLRGFQSRYPSQLSGGMRKRAALARTLIYDPETLLMDEPFGALDAQMRLVLQKETLSIWERDRKTVLFVTHDLEEAITLADKIIVMGTAPGRVIHEELVPFPRPRNMMDLRDQPEFHTIWKRLWTLIELQVAPTAS